MTSVIYNIQGRSTSNSSSESLDQRIRHDGLPDELWLMIWKSMSQNDRIRITKVSHSWRALAIHTPHLWSHIEIETTVHSEDCDCDICLEFQNMQPHNLRIIPLLLAQSGSLELHVAVRVVHGEDYYDAVVEDMSRLEAVVEILLPELYRIQALRVTVDEPRHVKMLMQAFNGAVFPRLRVLEFDYIGETARFNQIDPSEPFLEDNTVLSAENLERIWSVRPWFLWPYQLRSSEQLLGLHTISSLAVRVASISNIATILRVCPRLLHLRLYAQAVDVDSPTDHLHAPTTYPALDTLEIDCICNRLEPDSDDESEPSDAPWARIWGVISQLAVNARHVRVVYTSNTESRFSAALRCGLVMLGGCKSTMSPIVDINLGEFAVSDGWEGDMITLTLREEPASADTVGRTPALTFHPDILVHVLKSLYRHIDLERIQKVRLLLETASVWLCDEVENSIKTWIPTMEILVTRPIGS